MADKVRKLNEIDKEFLKSKTPYALPDNPSNKGFSASQIKAKMYEGHLVVYEWLKQLQAETNTAFDLNDVAIAVINSAIDTINTTKATKTELATLESNIEDGTITAYKATRDGNGLVIASNYGVALSLSYDENTNKITILLHSSDNTLLDTKYIALPLANATDDGLMSSADKVKLTDLPTKGQLDSALAVKVPQTRKILGLDLADDILLAEFKTAIGEATAILSGLMSATDKSRLDALHALLGVESDADAVVNTINEVLAIFSAYPEGADLVNALSGKVDKDEGKGLSTNDFTDILKAKLDSLLSGSNYYDKTYIDALKDLNGWSSALLTETALTNGGVITKATLSDYDVIKLFVIKTATGEIDTDSFDTSIGLVDNYKYVFFDNAEIYLSIANPNCTFTDNITGYQLKIIGQKYEAQDAEDVNYDKTVKNLLEAENVQDAIDEIADEVLAPAFVEVEHLALQSEITATNDIEIKDDSGELVKITGNTLPSEDVDVLKAMGIKNDSGVLFSALTPEEITEQLGIWEEQGYPTHINKLISKSDNLFNGKFNTLTSLASENLVANSDLLIDSDNNSIPNGFGSNDITDISLVNGIAKFTATAQYGQFYFLLSGFKSQTMYTFARFKSDSNNVHLTNSQSSSIAHSGSGQFKFLSFIETLNNNTRYLNIMDYRTSDWTPIEVDTMGAYNITDLVSRGILPQGLTNAQYKEILDNAIYNNVPLRESDFISVEPSVAYRLIKASENSVIHKVIEYTTDNQVVKVNSVDYNGNPKISAPITMNALTHKVKLISDLMDRVPNLISNSDLLIDSNADNVPNGFEYASATDISLTNGIAKFTPTAQYGRLSSPFTVTIGIKYYVYANIKVSVPNAATVNFNAQTRHSGSGNFEVLSNVFTPIDARTITVLDIRTSGFTPIEVDYIGAINITDFINKGVADDNGTLFSRLTNGEIKAQMDIWVQNGFPDSVINALYPDGADTAISLKYNGGDAIYYPQVIDELPLDITLRSGEYWQDGYIIKQNGNAEASPLGKVFSAWNYGQIEAIYDSGIPADFKVKYAQNTSAQVSTHSEYLKEARERIDTLRVNQKQLIEKSGIVVGSSGASYDYDDLLGLFNEVANNIYNKSETYSRAEVQDAIEGATANNKQYFKCADTYDLVVGDSFELFYKGILEVFNYEEYNILCQCDIGKCLTRKFAVPNITNAMVGNHSLQMTLYSNDGEQLDQKTITLRVVAQATSPVSEKVILCVGDSLTDGGQWADEFGRRLTKTTSQTSWGATAPQGLGLTNITFIGKKTSTGGIKYEGYGGWTFNSYLSTTSSTMYWLTATENQKTASDQESIWEDANGVQWQLETIETNRLKFKKYSGTGVMPSSGNLTWVSGGSNTSDITFTASSVAEGNPFVYNGQIDFSAYCADMGVSTIHEVYILLGWNNATTTNPPSMTHCKQFIDLLRAFNPSIKVVLIGLQIPSQEGCGQNYEATGIYSKYMTLVKYVHNLDDAYKGVAEEYVSGVYSVNLAGQFDTEYNMAFSDTTPNSRNPLTISLQSNGVHPAISGYYQIADVVYRWYNKNS